MATDRDSLDARRARAAVSNVRTPLRETASQTAGPYVHIGCLPASTGINGVYPRDLRSSMEIQCDQPIRIVGQVFEGEAAACKDVMLETWQADENGDFSRGIWLRSATDFETGEFTFETLRPGASVDSDGRTLAPSITVWVVARGINIGLLTRLYFADEQALNDSDPHLAMVEARRRATLIATPTTNDNEYRFDIHLQGVAETVFFDV